MSTTIYFVRHGEAKKKNEEKYRSYPGYNLTSDGKKEAKKVAGFFKERPINAIYSSPFFRTMETAQIIAKEKHLEVIEDRSVSEIPFGDTETAQGVIKRVKPFLERIIKNHEKGEIIVITHQGVIDSVNSFFLTGKAKYPYKGGVGLTSISEYELDKNLNVLFSSYIDVDPKT